MGNRQTKIKESNEKLMHAAAQLDTKEVRRLLALGADPNYVRETASNTWYAGYTETPLYSAIQAYSKQKEK